MGKKRRIAGFFKEIKNRHVHRAVIMYAAAAFIILQLTDILTPALSLPQWVMTLVIIFLAVGFPLAAILSWFFDFTSQGVVKTENITEEDGVEHASAGKRKFRVSDGVIAVLIVVVGILLYPKIFNKDKLNKVRDNEGVISIAVLPFDNLSNDSILETWQNGFQNLLISGLSNSKGLEVRQYQAINELIEHDRDMNRAAMIPPVAGDLGNKLNTKTVVLGSLMSTGDKIRVNAQLMNSDTEEIYKTFEAEANREDELFAAADTLSVMMRNYLEIEKIRKEIDNPELHKTFSTNSAEAFRSYILGYDDFMNLEFLPAARWFYRAIETDPDFTVAYVMLSYACHNMGNPALAREWVAKAYEKSDGMDYMEKLMIDVVNSFYRETPEEQITYLNQLISLDKWNPLYWVNLGSVYFNTGDYQGAAETLERSLEIHESWGTPYKNPFLYYMLGYSLHKTGDHKREKEILDIGLELYPEHMLVVQTQAICALCREETRKAEELIDKYINIRQTVTLCPSQRIEVGLGSIYAGANLIEKAEEHYRSALSHVPDEPEFINELAYFLVDKYDDEEKVSEGVDLIDKALETNPEHWLYLDTKAWGLYKLGRFSEALEFINKSWENRPAYNHNVYEHQKMIEKAQG